MATKEVIEDKEGIPLLWDKSKFSKIVRSPLAVLKIQANGLRNVSNCLFDAMVFSVTEGEKIKHRFALTSIADGVEYTICNVSHEVNKPYPCFLASLFFAGRTNYNCYSFEEFMQVLSGLFNSPSLNTLIDNTIANANEVSEK